MDRPIVSCHIVTWNHERTIRRAVQSLLAQEDPSRFELRPIVFDNASADDTLEELRAFPQIAIVRNPTNEGFCLAHNRLIHSAMTAGADFVFLMNPDLALARGALFRLITALNADPSAAAATPRLYRADTWLEPITPLTFDACGMFMTPALRHLDRGSGEIDRGQYRSEEYVFGGTGAALLLKRSAIESLALDPDSHQLLDENFFAYREDAELALRILSSGWKTRYVPSAVGFHVRKVLPQGRTKLPGDINRLGVRNRFLIQLNHLGIGYSPKVWICGGLRNLAVIAAVLIREHSSLGAFADLIRKLPRIASVRRRIAGMRRTSRRELSRWFAFQPHTTPALRTGVGGSSLHTLCAIVVNYNSGEHLRRCAESLLTAQSELAPEIKLDVIIFDNASTDERPQQLFRSYPQFRWILSTNNAGFSGAINQSLAQTTADAVVVMNPDITATADSLRKLCRALERHGDIGMLSPALIGEDGRPQDDLCARRFPTLGSTVAELLMLHRAWPSNPLSTAYHYSDDLQLRALLRGEESNSWRSHYPYVVDQPAGACMMLRTDVLRSLGGMDERFHPAWFEDVDLAKRIETAGLLSAVLPSARVAHSGGYSKDLIGESAFRNIFYSNMRKYWKKWGTALDSLIVRAAVSLGELLRRMFKQG